jgi:crotonobetainyl-CoA:carnitine CoA-transferase CaiB-like acyl-CoA transferase
MSDSTRPLAGIRVLDLTTFLSGPLAARTLADLGADVIRVEPPRGDPTRAGTAMKRGDPPSEFYLALHRDRRAVVLDLKVDAGRSVLRSLVAESDVLLENFRPGVTARLGVGYDDLATANPRLVYCSITGFGADGPAAGQPATDGAVQAFSGVLELTGDGDTFGLPLALPVADLVAGATAAQAILAALVRRERAGAGTRIEISMLEALLGWLLVGDRQRTLRPPTTMVLRGSDGEAVLVQTALHFQPRLAEMLAAVPGCEALATDERFATRDGREAHRAEYEALAAAAFRARTSDEWLAALRDVGIPASRIRRIDDALDHPQIAHARGTVAIDVPGLGARTVLASPFRFDGARKTDTTPPPTLGAHTTEVLTDLLGLTPDDLAALRADGAFGDWEDA